MASSNNHGARRRITGPCDVSFRETGSLWPPLRVVARKSAIGSRINDLMSGVAIGLNLHRSAPTVGMTLIIDKVSMIPYTACGGNEMGRRVAVAAIDSQVRARRLAAGLSQQGLAERCGLTRQAVSAIEGGQYIPNTAVALRLGKILGCTVEDLFRLPSEPPLIEAELLGEGLDTSRPIRVQLTRVGERMLARPLTGPAAPRTGADGFAHPIDQDPANSCGGRPV